MLRYREIHKWLRIAVFIVGGLGLILVFETGEHGAEMVFEHGVGVKAVREMEHRTYEDAAEHDEDHDENGEEGHHHHGKEEDAHSLALQRQFGLDGASSRASFVSADDGSWRWFVRDDAVEVLKNKAEFIEGSVNDLDATVTDSALSLRLSGKPVLFVFGRRLTNIAASASLNLDDFDGMAELAHHVQGESGYDFVAVGKGSIEDGRSAGDEVSQFDTDDFTGKGWIDLSIVSDGRHSRGYVGDKLFVHGHSDPPEPGTVGLLFDGKGVVQIRGLGATVLHR